MDLRQMLVSTVQSPLQRNCFQAGCFRTLTMRIQRRRLMSWRQKQVCCYRRDHLMKRPLQN